MKQIFANSHTACMTDVIYVSQTYKPNNSSKYWFTAMDDEFRLYSAKEAAQSFFLNDFSVKFCYRDAF